MPTISQAPIFSPAAHHVVLGHGVNTVGVMGAGFAKLIATRYPDVKDEYVRACATQALTPGRTQIVQDTSLVAVANIASQDFPGANAREDWLRKALRHMYAQLQILFPNELLDVRLPLIGAGIGGLDPLRAADIIFDEAMDARKAARLIRTTLHLLPSDSHTKSVIAHLSGS